MGGGDREWHDALSPHAPAVVTVASCACPQIDDTFPVLARAVVRAHDQTVIIGAPNVRAGLLPLPVFARSKRGTSLWMMALEKAFAKWTGTFADLNGGLVHRVLPMLVPQTWAQHLLLRSVTVDRLWELLVEAKAGRALVGAGSPVEQVDPESGIASGHAYAVLDVCEVHDVRGSARLVRLQCVGARASASWPHRNRTCRRRTLPPSFAATPGVLASGRGHGAMATRGGPGKPGGRRATRSQRMTAPSS